ncbi:MAG: hypothetical protein HYT35_00390 [Candidatus Staskawiczbacteria bacterium]|nr:hypothetical protein [Candidatus Staskawiczbacteria bacterium]
MSTTYSIGEMNQLAGALEKAGFTSDDVTNLRKFGRLTDFRRVIRGELELVELRVPNINLEKVYDLLGMSREYEEATQKFDLTEDPTVWKLVMLKGVTCNKLVEAYKEAGVKMYLYQDDLDKEVQDNQRDPNRDGSYLVSFRRNAEADQDNQNQSANDRKEKNCQDITLAERLLLGLAYFLATKEHLDVKNWTLCAGSRDRYGDVPLVRWDPGRCRVRVFWCFPDFRFDNLRSRRGVLACGDTRKCVGAGDSVA